VRTDSGLLVRKFRDAAERERATWDEALSPEAKAAVARALDETVPHAISGTTWSTIVYDLLVASARRPERTDAFVRALVPLYFARVAAFIDDARDMTTSASERLVEDQAAAFEERKPYLRERFGRSSPRSGARGAEANAEATRARTGARGRAQPDRGSD
jgi:hypothetical protein